MVILALSTGIGYGAYEDISRPLYDMPIPRLLIGSLDPGTVPLGSIWVNKFYLDQNQTWRLLSVFAGLVVGLLILVLAFMIKRLIGRRLKETGGSFGYWIMATFLLIGVIFTPTLVLGGGYRPPSCEYDTIKSFEESGFHLAKYIPPGSTIYWRGGLSVVPLLYVPGIKIYPPQVNDGYSRAEGDTNIVLKFGLWNNELEESWAKSADSVLIEKRSDVGWLREYVNSGIFDELPTAPPTVLCREDYAIHIFRRRN